MHSLAGVLASEIADRLGERLVSCVYISAIIPADGSTFTKAIGFPGRLLLPILFFFNPGGLLPSEAMIRNELCTDLSKDDCSMVINRYEAEFPGLYLTKVAGPPKCHSAYIRLLNDASISPIQQSNMIAHLDEPDVFELAAGHMVMLSQPEDLANILNHIVELPGSKQLPVL
jgi:pimeloyl-ACP methyl ester carboxylesterase